MVAPNCASILLQYPVGTRFGRDASIRSSTAVAALSPLPLLYTPDCSANVKSTDHSVPKTNHRGVVTLLPFAFLIRPIVLAPCARAVLGPTPLCLTPGWFGHASRLSPAVALYSRTACKTPLRPTLPRFLARVSLRLVNPLAATGTVSINAPPSSPHAPSFSVEENRAPRPLSTTLPDLLVSLRLRDGSISAALGWHPTGALLVRVEYGQCSERALSL